MFVKIKNLKIIIIIIIINNNNKKDEKWKNQDGKSFWGLKNV